MLVCVKGMKKRMKVVDRRLRVSSRPKVPNEVIIYIFVSDEGPGWFMSKNDLVHRK